MNINVSINKTVDFNAPLHMAEELVKEYHARIGRLELPMTPEDVDAYVECMTEWSWLLDMSAELKSSYERVNVTSEKLQAARLLEVDETDFLRDYHDAKRALERTRLDVRAKMEHAGYAQKRVMTN